MSGRLKKFFCTKTAKFVAAFLILIISTLVFRSWLDNDSWFILAEGRYVAENGLFDTDVLSMHSDMSVVPQQYGAALIFWLIYQAFGPAGLYIMMLLVSVIIYFLLYKIFMLLSKKNINVSLLLTVAAGVLLNVFCFMTTRPHIFSYALMLAVIYVLELYLSTKKTKLLWLLPVLSVVQINLHASLWWMLPLVFITYIVDGVRKPKLYLQGYKLKPLIIAGVAMFAAGFLNPYGIKMITYVLSSYGSGTINMVVSVMSPFDLRSLENVVMFAAIVGVLLFCIFGKSKNIRMRHLLMFFGFLALSINSVRAIGTLILVMFFPLATIFKDADPTTTLEDKKARGTVEVWSMVVLLVVASCLFVGVVTQLKEYPYPVIYEAINVLDETVEKYGQNKAELKIYVGYNDGGYFEFRGYKPYLDPRAEVFLKKNNKKKDILAEWIDFADDGMSDRDKFLKEYDFDYIYADNFQNSRVYELGEDYELIYDYNNSDEDGGEKIRIYRHIRENE